VLFICENNGYATEVPFSYACSTSSVAARGKAYGLPGVAVDGNDVLAVYQAAAEAVERARGGQGPTLLECVTYRVRSHAEGMVDFTYRTREEVDSWKKQCPLLRLRQGLVDEAVGADPVQSEQLDAIDQEVADRVAAAHQAAVAAPYAGRETASEHIYAAPNATAQQETGDVGSQSCRSGEREITYVEATLEALGDAMANDPTIFVLGEGVGERGGNFNTTTGLHKKYGPVRLCDTPICERGFVGLSAGAAMTGTRPVIDFMFADFILDAIGEILNQIAKIQYMSNGRLKMPVLLRGCIGIGHSAATHHSGSYYSMYAHFPGLRVVVPSTPYDVPFGKAAVVCEGADVTLVALAEMVHKSMAAIKELQSRGISVELIDPRTVAPLDCETILQSVAKTGRLLIADETFGPYGIGAEISAQVSQRGFDDLDAPIHRLNGAHTPTPYSPALEKTVIPQVEDIVEAVLDLLEE
jgi:2-oxoisovalerate dehydrogenase E1 component